MAAGAIETTAGARGRLPAKGCAMLWLHLGAVLSVREPCDYVA